MRAANTFMKPLALGVALAGLIAAGTGLTVPPNAGEATFRPGLVDGTSSERPQQIVHLVDCNGNGIPDECDIDCGVPGGPCDLPGCGQSADCNGNGIPDECEEDCNENGIPDDCDIADCAAVHGNAPWCRDCQPDGVPDGCQLVSGGSEDAITVTVFTDAYPNETTWTVVEDGTANIMGTGGPYAQPDTLYTHMVPVNPELCYTFTIFDSFGDGICCDWGNGYYEVYYGPDLVGSGGEFGTSETIAGICAEPLLDIDCNDNLIPDECELGGNDCNGNGLPDDCDINQGNSSDLNGNGLPDECEDCDQNGLPDECDLSCGDPGGPCDHPGCGNDADCNSTGVPDACELEGDDCNLNGVPDECDLDPADPDGNGETSDDCNADGVPDDCEMIFMHSALHFDRYPSSCSDAVWVEGTPALQPIGELTLEVWIRPDSTSRWNSGIIRIGHVSNGYSLLWTRGTDERLQFRLEHTSEGEVGAVDDVPVGTYSGRWVHVAGVYSVTQNYCRLYVDGVLEDSQPAAGTIVYYQSDLYLGGVPGCINAQSGFEGLIDEVRIWNVARTQQQILDHKDALLEGPQAGLVGYWRFNEGQGQTVHDRSPYGHDGVLGYRLGPWADPADPTWVIPGAPIRDKDCNDNGVLDECDIAAGTSEDCNENLLPDECETGENTDCNNNGTADLCEPGGIKDCNLNGQGDLCDISSGYSQDCNLNNVPDECDITSSRILLDPMTPLAAGGGQGAVGIDDLDGDGDLDLVTTGANTLSVFLNVGDGSFESAVHYAVGAEPRAVIAALLNDDDIPDLATANRTSDDISVLLGNGDGTFSPSVQYWAGNGSRDVDAADIDGDGDLDLISANSLPQGGISILRGRGDGTFMPAAMLPDSENADAVKARDLDGDGDVDLASHRGASLAIRLNNGDGTFQAAAYYELPWSASHIAPADLDNDGDWDLAVSGYYRESVAVLFNDGNAVYTLAADYEVGSRPRALAAADVNGDGWIDIVTPNSDSDNISILQNNRNGTFASAIHFLVGHKPYAVGVGDFDADGLPDLAVANSGTSDVSVFLNATTLPTGDDCNGNLVPDECDISDETSPDCNLNGVPDECDIPPLEFAFDPMIDLAAGDGPRFVLVQDLDGDGDNDLVSANSESDNVSVFLNGGDGSFMPPVHYAVGAEPFLVKAALLDEDDFLDLAVANMTSGDVSVLLGHGDGSFSAAISYAAGAGARDVEAADLDDDGDLDLITANYFDDTISILNGYGDGTFAAPVTLSTGAAPRSAKARDLDGDGDLDLAVANLGGHNIAVFLKDGGGAFSAAHYYEAGAWPSYIAAADFDKDGDVDIAVSNQDDDEVSVLVNDGNADFSTRVAYPVGAIPLALAAGDLNHDGWIDLVVPNWESSNVSILANWGDGTFAPANSVPAGINPYGVGIGDLDGDGLQDLAVANFGSHDISLILNTADVSDRDDCNLNGLPDECDIADGTSRDCNGNDTPDECEADAVPCGDLDIKPGSCPNPFNRSSQGYLPVAIAGYPYFDVTTIDVASVRLSRADGVGGEVAPNEGPPGPHSVFADVATPFDGEPCDCHEAEGDGIDDLSMKFKRQELVAALELDAVDAGTPVELVASGLLLDGSPFATSGDCILILAPPNHGRSQEAARRSTGRRRNR